MASRWLIPFLAATAILFPRDVTADWRQVKESYLATRAGLEKKGLPATDYQVRVSGKTVALPPAPELGINVHRLDDRTAADLRRAGVRFIRRTVYWYHLEKTDRPGVYDQKELARLDEFTARCRRDGLEPLLLVHGNAPGCRFANRQDAYRRFAALMAMLAARYPDVRYWELWNEMDTSFTDLFGARDKTIPMKQRGRYYAEMLKLAYPAIKQANPAALVLTGGMTNWNDFPQGIYENGGRNYFDIMNLHTYGVPLIWSFVLRGAELRRVMDRNGDRAKPIWNTEFGISAEAMIKAWGIPKSGEIGPYFDLAQKNALADCIDFNLKTGLYHKYFIYAYAAGSEARGKLKEELKSRLPENTVLDDLSFSLVRRDGTPRPAMTHLFQAQPNRRLLPAAASVRALAPAAKPPERLKLVDGELRRGNEPFFPLGLVFGRTPEDLRRAREVGMNSIHQEYSIKDLFPDGPDRISPAGLRRITDLHRTVRESGLMYFPLLTGHYIPPWLSKTAGPAPRDAEGQKIGLWFRHSIHDPVFRATLEKFWTTVAREVGNDPNSGAFVTWNEPAYGLDATPRALAAFRDAMKQKYGTIQRFNDRNRTGFASFDAVKPPVHPDDNRSFWYEWFTWNQQSFADFFRWEREVFKRQAPEALLSGKHPVSVLTGDALFCNDIVLQAASQDIYGCDAYNGSLFHYRDVMEAARSLNPQGPAITYETHGQKGIPPLKPQHAALQLFTQIIGGCRGLFFFCNGSREKNFGFFSDQATPPPVREAYVRLFRLIDSHQDAFAAPRAKADIAVLLSNPSTLHYGAGPDRTAHDTYTKRLAQTFDLVRNQHFAVDFIADRQLGSKLAQYRLLAVPSLSILDNAGLEAVAEFHRRGGKLLVFGRAFERDEDFRPRSIPAFLGLKKRVPAPWNRDQMRLVEVAPELNTAFLTELIVQSPEQVNPQPMEQAIPGYVAQTALGGHRWLAANQDAYPSIILSSDGQVVYCAFDSLYSEGLSALIGGIVTRVFALPREIGIRREGEKSEALEVMSALGARGRSRFLLLANCGPNPGSWTMTLNDRFTGTMWELAGNRNLEVKEGTFHLTLPPYGYAVGVYELPTSESDRK